MIKADFHTHTRFSSDSDSDLDEVIAFAVKKGLNTICITDHQDFDYPVNQSGLTFLFDTNSYFKELNKLKDKYSDSIDIRIGVELGLMDYLANRYNSYISNYDFDFIIGSSHLVKGMDPYYPEYHNAFPGKTGVEQYFISILDNIKAFQNFDVYGHLDYIIRYIPDKNFVYNCLDYKDLIDCILKELVNLNKGIELNTAGIRKNVGLVHPHPYILKRYKEIGGEIITIGSDAHTPSDIACDFNTANDILIETGFKYYTVFKKRKPEFIPLT